MAYGSRRLSKAEELYTASELECLCVVWAIERFRAYLEGSHFTVVTDHSSLVWLQNLKDTKGRLGRWLVRLQQFQFTIVHRKGKLNGGPDALSRNPVEEATESRAIELISVFNKPDDKWYKNLYYDISKSPDMYEDFKLEGEQILKQVVVRKEPTWMRVVPLELRKDALRECHDEPLAGHFGAKKTFERLKELYFWPKMKHSCNEYVKRCEVCKRHKSSQLKAMGFMGEQRRISAPMEIVSSDLMGPFPSSSSGFQYVVVTLCLFSKYVWIRPLTAATANGVASHLENDVFLRYGAPKILLSDNGVQYKNKLIRELCEPYGVKQWFTYSYHPEANPTERVYRVLKVMISSYLQDNQRL